MTADVNDLDPGCRRGWRQFWAMQCPRLFRRGQRVLDGSRARTGPAIENPADRDGAVFM